MRVLYYVMYYILYTVYCVYIYIYISYIAHISCIYRVYMEKIILSHLNCRVLPIASQVSSEYPHPQWIWSHLLPLWCASSRGQSSSLRSSTKLPWLWTRNHQQKTYVRAIWVCVYIYVHTLPGTSTKISCAFSTRTTGDSGDIGCTALITGRSKSFFVSIPFRKQFSRGSKKHHNAYQMLYKLSPLLQKNILDFRSQNKGCYRGILYIS